MYMYTAGIVHSSAAAYTSKASAGTQADNASAICQLVRVPSKRGTSYHTKRYTRILFFHSNTHPLFSPFFPLHWFQNAASRPLNACFVRKQNEVTENKAPPSRPHKETKYAEEKQNVRCFCMVGSTCPLPAPPTHTHTAKSLSWCWAPAMYTCSQAATGAWWGRSTGGWRGEATVSSFRPAAPPSGWLADWVTVPAVEVWYMGSRPTVMMSSMASAQVAGRSCRRRP